MTREELLEDLAAMIVSLGSPVAPEAIVEEAEWEADIGVDSLDQVEMIMLIEDRFDLDIPDAAWERWKTIADTLDWLQAQVLKA